MLAADIMTRNVITAGPDSLVHDIAWLMTEHHISSVPIVANGTIVGIVSESDLLHRVELGTADVQRGLADYFASTNKRARDYIKTHSRRARDVMTSAVVVVNTQTPLDDVVRTLADRGLKRVPVLDETGAVVGVISRANLVRALVARPPATATPDDTAIRIALLAEYETLGWAPADPANILVEEGVVHLWGRIRSADVRKAMQVAAENIPGVKAVENHLDEGDLSGDPFDRPQWVVSTKA